MEIWVRLGLLVGFAMTILYFWALGKNVEDEEKKQGKDLTYDINPYNGERIVTDEEKAIELKRKELELADELQAQKELAEIERSVQAYEDEKLAQK